MNLHLYRASLGGVCVLSIVTVVYLLLQIPMWLLGATYFGSVIVWINVFAFGGLFYCVGGLLTTYWRYEKPVVSHPTIKELSQAAVRSYPSHMEPEWDENNECVTFLFEGNRMNWKQMKTLKETRAASVKVDVKADVTTNDNRLRWWEDYPGNY